MSKLQLVSDTPTQRRPVSYGTLSPLCQDATRLTRLVRDSLYGLILVLCVSISPLYSMMQTTLIKENPFFHTAGCLACMLTLTCLVNAVVAALRMKYLATRGRAEAVTMNLLGSHPGVGLYPLSVISLVVISCTIGLFMVVLLGCAWHLEDKLPADESCRKWGLTEKIILTNGAIALFLSSFIAMRKSFCEGPNIRQTSQAPLGTP